MTIKSKAFKFLLGIAVVIGVAVAASFASAADFGTATLRVGSRGAAVMEVQKLVGVTPDGAYGPLTKAAVEAWQANNGLVPVDGIFGAMSRAKAYELAGSTGAVTPNLCLNGMTYASNCTVAPGTTTPVTLCLNGMTFASNCTVAPGDSTSKPSTVRGGAGDLTVTSSSKNIEDKIKEGTEENVLALKVEADDSDIEITNLKLEFTNASSNGSEKLTDYADEVKVYLGSDEVASVDVSDFTRDSGSPDLYTKSVSLDGAIVSEGDTDYLYVAVVASSDIDTSDVIPGHLWTVTAKSVRFTDGTGAIMTDNANKSDTFEFKLASEDDDLRIKSSSANPDNTTVRVYENKSSDDILALAFKLDNDEDSSDMDLESLAVKATIKDPTGAIMTSIDTVPEAEKIIDSVKLKIAGESFDAEDLRSGDIVAGVITYYFDIDGDVTIDAGDVEEAKVYVTFYKQDSPVNYANSSTVKFVVDYTGIEAEVDGDEVDNSPAGDIRGSQTGATLTVNSSAALVSNMKWVVSSTGTILDFFFTVEAEDDDCTVLASEILDSTTGTADFVGATEAKGAPVTRSEGTLTRYSGDKVAEDDTTPFGLTVSEGDTVKFRVRYSLDGGASGANNGKWAEVTIGSVAGQTVAEDLQTSDTATISL